ncbi:alpha/beta fold hydrolase [Kineococcus sp. LSe6-4]|uniref:Alpha/beta fold hydrolase n=1 Tax=Kineococcus halophytocola TaxID=3234027 RepID=A0ABV4H221_9ACTN
MDALGVLARRVRDRDGGTLDRPLAGGGSFPLTWVRSGPAQDAPVLFVPGGPGMASVLPYARLRATAAAHGVGAVMVEHRGVGLSRHDGAGQDLDPAEVTVQAAADDLAAVLDHLGIERVVVHGSSYGTYVAQVFGVRHPHRVAAMVLDSPLLSVADDLAAVRAHRRGLLWEADTELAAAVRSAAAAEPDTVAAVAPTVYEFAGPAALLRLLHAHRDGRLGPLWRRLSRLADGGLDGRGVRHVTEPDLVAGIAFGQLGFGLPPDGGPLDPQVAFARVAGDRPPYRGEPYDLPALLPGFTWPTVVVSGDRDLRTPRPVAERLARLLPHGVLLDLPGLGHSAMDTHQRAAVLVAAAVRAGAADRLPALAGRLAALPRQGASRWLGTAVRAAVRLGG